MDTEARTLIVGLGKTGLSCARFLTARHIPVAVTDSRAEPPGLASLQNELPEVPLFMGGFNPDIFARAECLVVSPGVSVHEPAIAKAAARGVPVIGDIELFIRHTHAPVAAITGSNGKSTVTALLGEMARRATWQVRVGGNFGTPALDMLGEDEPDLYVLELSSFQLETTSSLNARAAVVLNISPDHMDRYADVEEYTSAKQRIYMGNGAMIINKDDAAVSAMIEPGRRVLRFGLGEPGSGEFGLRTSEGEPWLSYGEQPLLPVRELRIKGNHNVSNALAALALGQALDLPRAAMLAALREFPGLPHRSEWVAEQAGIQWYNDSKGTNVGATLAALQGLAAASTGKVVLIAGGDGKGADFTPLRAGVAARARAVVLIGRDAALIETALAAVVPVVHARDMTNAVHAARVLAQSGDAVLLSPACASFDMYSGYDERGRVFVSAVQAALGASGRAKKH